MQLFIFKLVQMIASGSMRSKHYLFDFGFRVCKVQPDFIWFWFLNLWGPCILYLILISRSMRFKHFLFDFGFSVYVLFDLGNIELCLQFQADLECLRLDYFQTDSVPFFLPKSFLAHLAKGNVSFCHHLVSVVCRPLSFHILIFSETS